MGKISLLLFFLSSALFAQEVKNDLYAELDSISRSIKYEHDLDKLSFALTENCHTEIEKARALFVWITYNIKYDYKQYNKTKGHNKIKTFRCKNKVDCEQKKIALQDRKLKRILKKKKAICSGYSELFKKMCGIVGINCQVIDGYTKSKVFQIGKTGKLNHAWNVVIIDTNYYYFDLTWASGYCWDNKKGKLKGFRKSFK